MRITNVANWRNEVETAMVETFAYTSTIAQEIVTQKEFRIKEPTVILKDDKYFAIVEVIEDGSIFIWDSNYDLYTLLNVNAFKNKMSMLCYLTKNIMMMDKYNTMF